MPQYTQRERGKAGQQQGQPNIKRDVVPTTETPAVSLFLLSRRIRFKLG
jgi:hypothetical protein